MTMTDELRTLGAIEVRAKEVLRPEVWGYGYGGASSESTLERNRRALQRLAIEQRVLVDVRHIDLSARFLDLALPSPVIVAPMGGLFNFHPDGDVEMARGAGRDGGLSVVSGVCGWPVEQIGAEATGPLMYQLYYLGDRGWIAERLQRVAASGFRAWCVTADLAVYSRRERDITSGFAGRGRGGTEPPPPSNAELQASLSWADVDWLHQQISLPFGIKGILSAADARRALDAGVDFIWASNHGGRALDDGRATIDVLPEIIDVVGGRVPIIVDGGFRRGSDIMKGLALGATLVALGRTILWGLAVDGADGVQHALHLVNEELRINLALAGQTGASKLPADLIRKVDY